MFVGLGLEIRHHYQLDGLDIVDLGFNCPFRRLRFGSYFYSLHFIFSSLKKALFRDKDFRQLLFTERRLRILSLPPFNLYQRKS